MDNTWVHLLFAFDAYNIVFSVEKTETICSKRIMKKAN